MRNNQPLISVIVPAYNSEKYIERCLTSIVNNTFHNLQIICVNDGSKDNTLDLLNRLQEIEPRIQIINHLENKGVSFARNEGMSYAIGEYITFIDSDDWIHPRYFEVLLNEMETGNCDIVVSGFIRTSEEQDALPNINANSFKSHTYKSLSEAYSDDAIKYYVWGKLYRKKVISSFRFETKIHLAEDGLFNADILLNNSNLKIAKINQPMYVYYNHNESAVHLLSYKDSFPAYYLLYRKIITMEKTDVRLNNNMLTEIVKQAFIMRYNAMVLKDKGYCKKISGLIAMCIKHMEHKNIIKKLGINIFYRSPYIYRIWRIISDPSLLIWEKNYKEQNG